MGKEFSMTPTCCWVLLYRARMALQQGLETTWFAEVSQPSARGRG